MLSSLLAGSRLFSAKTLPNGDNPCPNKSSLCESVLNTTHNSWLASSSDWLIAKPLKIILIIVIAVLLRLVIHRLIRHATRTRQGGRLPAMLRPLRDRAPEAVRESAAAMSERHRQRAGTIGSVLRSITSAVIGVIAVMLVLGELGINLAPLLASAGIVGVAVGFGAQNLVRDFLSGLFMLLEDQYGVGDTVDLGEASGTVEAVGLRISTLRDATGAVWYIRNGEILRVGNMTQGWADVTVDVPVAYGTPIGKATAAMQRALDAMASDEQWKSILLDRPQVLGVQDVTALGMTVRTTARSMTEPQWRLAREMRRRLTDALDAEGISAGMAIASSNAATAQAVAGTTGQSLDSQAMPLSADGAVDPSLSQPATPPGGKSGGTPPEGKSDDAPTS